MSKHATVPRNLVLTQGEPRGIGPELLLRVAATGDLRAGDRVVADREWLADLGTNLPGGFGRRGFAAIEPLLVQPAASDAVACLERGVDLVLADVHAGKPTALVTAPIDKAVCNEIGFAFPGHTEYLAHRAGVDDVVMMMAGPRLRVALATVHLALRHVPERLDERCVVRAGRRLAEALRALHPRRVHIGVLGLNPHAGERGLLGDEDQRVVAPAVQQLQALDIADFTGPLPADTAFAAHAMGRYDGLVAMYHDQGLAPFKLLHFHDGVNVTLGLPFVRTSPDHGTAYDLVGRGESDPTSMLAAIAWARGTPA